MFPQPDGSVEFVLPPGKSVRRFRRVTIDKKEGVLDALTLLRRLAEFVPPAARAPDKPVFVSFARARDGVQRFPPLSRSKFIARVKLAVTSVLGYSPDLFAGYSLRRGGVTEMIISGVPIPVLKAHMGWAPDSDAFCAYYDHMGRVQLRLATRAMAART